MVNPPATQARLGHLKALAGTAQDVIRGNPDVFIVDIGVVAFVFAFVANTDIPNDVDTRCVGRDNEHGHALIRRGVRVGHGHDDQETCPARVGRKPLLAVDNPLVAIPFGLALEHLGVGAGVRLGHGKARHDLIVEQGCEKALFQFRRAVVGQYFAVARIRGLAAEDDGRKARATQYLVHEGELELTVAGAAQFRPQMAGPQAALPDLFLELGNNFFVTRILNIVLIT